MLSVASESRFGKLFEILNQAVDKLDKANRKPFA